MSYQAWVGAVACPFVGIALLVTGIGGGSWLSIMGGVLVLAASVTFDIRILHALWTGREGLQKAKHWSGD
ncbi:MAG TPA: hypothetical protein VG435_08660 [Acidimicrobiales bacterium]|jgi:hypothetical protein|nr:hypothetical protein [Acidimicrobiales bacterium]